MASATAPTTPRATQVCYEVELQFTGSIKGAAWDHHGAFFDNRLLRAALREAGATPHEKGIVKRWVTITPIRPHIEPTTLRTTVEMRVDNAHDLAPSEWQVMWSRAGNAGVGQFRLTGDGRFTAHVRQTVR